MLSTIPAMLPSDPLLHFPAFDGGFTPIGFPLWDELFPALQSPKPMIPKSDISTQSSGPVQSPNTVISSSGSDGDPNRNQSDESNRTPCQNDDSNRNQSDGSDRTPCQNDDSNRTVTMVDERKRRRMISNRESARRSRMRKQKHLENLRNQVNRLKVENRELNNRLRFCLYHVQRARTDNDSLRVERTVLRQKLSEIRQILVYRQLQHLSSAWPCNTLIAE